MVGHNLPLLIEIGLMYLKIQVRPAGLGECPLMMSDIRLGMGCPKYPQNGTL